jgi:hypothetical protein
MYLDLMRHAPLPKTVGLILAGEVPRGSCGITSGEGFADLGKDFVEGIKDRFITRKAGEPIGIGWLKKSVGNAQIRALEHFSGVSEEAADGPSGTVLDGGVEASGARGRGKALALSSEYCDVIHGAVLLAKRRYVSEWKKPDPQKSVRRGIPLTPLVDFTASTCWICTPPSAKLTADAAM